MTKGRTVYNDGWSAANVALTPRGYPDGRIGPHDLWDVLEGTGGQRYLVQKVWSVRDGRPVAFAGGGSETIR